MDIIPGYDGYYLINTQGDVFSKFGSRKLKQTPNSNGYLRVFLFKDGKTSTFYVHRLVGLLYLGLDINDSNTLVCHKNDIKDDNRLENLFLGTPKDNMHDMIAKGRNSRGSLHQIKNRGEKSKKSRISNEQARNIKLMISQGIKLKRISIELSVPYHTVKSINLGRSWKWLVI